MGSVLNKSDKQASKLPFNGENNYEFICLNDIWLTENLGHIAFFVRYTIRQKDKNKWTSKGITKHGKVLLAIAKVNPLIY